VSRRQHIRFGRRKFAFAQGKAELTSTSFTERALRGEDEQAFTDRLLKIYGRREGTIEMVFKGGNPD
jgi:hypothetical protein